MDTKTLKYKYLYNGHVSVRELLQLVQEADLPVGNMAIIDILARFEKLEVEVYRLKMEAEQFEVAE